MGTRTRIGPGKGLVIGLIAGLAAHQATAAEELIVYGNPSTLGVRLDHAAIRADIDNYVNSLNEQLRATLSQEVKALSLPRIVIAGDALETRG
jgi:hypothetical protein